MQIGLRDVEPEEKENLRNSGVKAFTMSDVDRLTMARVMEEAISIAGAGNTPIHVSFDLDAIDPREAPGTGTPVKGGLSFREAHLAMEMLAESRKLGSIEMVEINPILDTRNHTATLAVGLFCSGLGKAILLKRCSSSVLTRGSKIGGCSAPKGETPPRSFVPKPVIATSDVPCGLGNGPGARSSV